MNKQGLSWKMQLKKLIDDTVRTSESFTDFIIQLRSKNITVKYEPYKKKDGMILAYKMEGQKNFIYSETLGKFYTEEGLTERIERSVGRRNMTRTERRQERILNDDGKLKRLIDVDSLEGIALQTWARNENRKINMQTIIELHSKGFSCASELFDHTHELRSEIDRFSHYYEDPKNTEWRLSMNIKYAEIYHEYKDIYSYYKNDTLYPERYFRSHEREILLFKEAKTELEKCGINYPNIGQLTEELEQTRNFLDSCRGRLREMRHELSDLDTLEYNLGIIYPEVTANYAHNEPTERAERTLVDLYESELEDEPDHEPVEREASRTAPSKRSRGDDWEMEL